MIAVIFEVHLADGQTPTYLDIASELRPLLADIDGFISIERFQSLTDDSKILSLSFWKNEVAVQKWRTLEAHRLAQAQGRGGVFEHYRLRVAGVIRDYSMSERVNAPVDSKSVHG